MNINAQTEHRAVSAEYAREIMLATGLKQQEMADRLGLSRVTIGNYFAGKMPMPYTVQVCLELLSGSAAVPAHDSRYAANKSTA